MKDIAPVKNIYENSIGQYLYVENSDQKAWLLPKSCIKASLNIYQPSSNCGKIWKYMLPYVYMFPFMHKPFHLTVVDCNIDTMFVKYLEEIFEKDVQLSIFFGTPSVHQKPTIQISKGEKLLGYCKVTKNNNVIAIFRNEKDILSYLNVKQVTNCPICLGLESVRDSYIFVQNTAKTINSKYCDRLTPMHVNFLKQLAEKTFQVLLYKNTDFKKNIDQLELTLDILGKEQKLIILKSIERVHKYYGTKEVQFCVAHRDFTPWNTYITGNELFVFDFEYAQKTYPPYIDMFHFFTQQALMVNHNTAEEIYRNCKKLDLFWKVIDNPDQVYIAYILDTISLYLSRNHGQLTENEKKRISILIELINLLNKGMILCIR
jgi:thiamine kinase-like enzyme